MKLLPITAFSLTIACLLAPLTSSAQSVSPTSPEEDITSLSVASSHLHPNPPELVEKDEEPDYISEWITVRWRADDPIYLYVVRPARIQKPPVVIYLYDYPAETDIFRDDDWCRRMTSGGYAAVGFVPALNGHRFHDRALKEWFVSELQESLAKSSHDVQMVLNYLDERGDIDMTHVGLFGVGSGATIAIAAASTDSRIKAIDVVDPWGDWPVWMSQSTVVPADERPNYEKPEFLKSISGFDPVALLPRLATPHIRLNQSTRGSSTPKEASASIKAALSAAAEHQSFADGTQFDPMIASGGSGFDWIKQQLKPAETNVRSKMIRGETSGHQPGAQQQ